MCSYIKLQNKHYTNGVPQSMYVPFKAFQKIKSITFANEILKKMWTYVPKSNKTHEHDVSKYLLLRIK
jgi:hypothetical protein